MGDRGRFDISLENEISKFCEQGLDRKLICMSISIKRCAKAIVQAFTHNKCSICLSWQLLKAKLRAKKAQLQNNLSSPSNPVDEIVVPEMAYDVESLLASDDIGNLSSGESKWVLY